MGRSEAKVTVAKLLELAYSKDKGLTVKIMAQKGSAKLTVDQDGKATLSGSAGVLTFDGDPALKEIGADVSRVSVSFTNQDAMKIGYNATFHAGIATMSAAGSFDLETLITSCSGLLCQAARAMKGRNRAYDQELQKIMGI